MSSSVQRVAANRSNAIKSTGPVTAAGKIAASRNATYHGLLSARLVLDDEDPAEFEALLLDLQAALAPVGAPELLLVERIAVTLWRQRRLVTAESAAIGLARQPHHIARGVSEELRRGYGDEFEEEDLQSFDPDQVAFCKAVIAEVTRLERMDLATLPKLAPNVYGQLETDAEDEEAGIEGFLEAQEKGLTGYVAALLDWCQKQLAEADRRPRLLALAQQVRAKRLVLPEATLEILSRYQTTLDNQLYKALRALREAQDWRLKTIEAAGEDNFAPVPDVA